MAVAVAVAVAVSGGGAVAAAGLTKRFFNDILKDFLINRPRYSKRTENFKRPKNREDSSDLDENLTESIAAMRSIISEIFGAARLQKNCFQNFFHASCCLNIYRCLNAFKRVSKVTFFSQTPVKLPPGSFDNTCSFVASNF